MSRASVVAMLIAAEVLIVGMAVYAVSHGGTTFASGMHHVDFTPVAQAPVAAGDAPHVVVDDEQSRVGVTISNDGLVHVRDLTEMRGAVFSSGAYPQLHVSRTSDGVRIERPSTGHLSIDVFGFSNERIEVEVPRASRLEIARCSGADVSGITGGVSVRSMDGHITLADLQGTVDAHSSDGYVEATNVRGARLAMDSLDGHLSLQNVAVESLAATTHDGRIVADGLNLVGAHPDATLHTDDGSVRVHVPPSADVTINASTSDGSIVVDGVSQERDDSAARTIRLGDGTAKMTVGTSDGSIHIYTNGASLQ
ncbi:MAG: DUF4097 family beta strand repeat protein [Candidatus Eremiobacteraeota bacterium]|nr:DUF4097 family beta strand repeat protein [Candidatus Eremiobacteraeota bacterium]MBV8498951.1 DUF4097 family beta strand repeat protein [Candidatus Eremiobacteraeota bacterium]